MNWVFQYNPRRFDQLKRRDAGSSDWWSMKQNRDIVSAGDRVFFWRSGPEAGLTMVGRVISPVYERESQFGDFAVDVQFDAEIDPVLTREEVRQVSALSDAAIFQGWQGTNFRLRDDQAAALESILAGRLRGVSSVSTTAAYGNLQELSEAINRSNHRVKAELRKLVQDMDPRAFEFLVRRVLVALGYQNVVVTRYSGDKGIDATAVFHVGGATPVDVAVQAKRTSTVDRPTVQNLRGSLTSRQLGLIVTSGTFTSSAVVEAQEAGKVPIGLIDGSKLLEHMIAHGIGVREKAFPALSLFPESLTLDELNADVSN